MQNKLGVTNSANILRLLYKIGVISFDELEVAVDDLQIVLFSICPVTRRENP
jgi:hypothetical protein